MSLTYSQSSHVICKRFIHDGATWPVLSPSAGIYSSHVSIEKASYCVAESHKTMQQHCQIKRSCFCLGCCFQQHSHILSLAGQVWMDWGILQHSDTVVVSLYASTWDSCLLSSADSSNQGTPGCGGKIRSSPPLPLSLAEDWATAGVWRYRYDGDGQRNGGVREYRGSWDGQSDGEYIFGKP